MTSGFSEEVVEGSGAAYGAATILGTTGMTLFSDQNCISIHILSAPRLGSLLFVKTCRTDFIRPRSLIFDEGTMLAAMLAREAIFQARI